jgi:hypothetical protein
MAEKTATTPQKSGPKLFVLERVKRDRVWTLAGDGGAFDGAATMIA